MFARSCKHPITLQNNLFVAGAVGKPTQKPENHIGLKKDPIVLKCSSNTSPNAITWQYDSFAVSGAGCKPTADAVASGFSTISAQATDCFFQIGQKERSGPYRCNDGSTPHAQAVVIIVGK